MIAWDQCASGWDNSPVSATLERQAGRWLLEVLDLPRDSTVGFWHQRHGLYAELPGDGPA
ncbi:hypothetical protein ERHA55_51830 (plasmid) [Erwinia rhapontici]|nr:hypothetical protein ERHA55_51830 [Erwinia rhapontici]